MSNAIEIKHLEKRYEGFALRDVNITLPSGYIMGFIGENGAGKTTTIKAMMGLVRPRYWAGLCLMVTESCGKISEWLRKIMGFRLKRTL